ncbi:F-box/LRR-repeat protein 17 isoform X2 [Pseudophryne corroboree]|uniref:F-box/LRR-repeat protein 17 isoform X2 n=1 Tax=Pseudophryne corroboree TaxID=495146 RepID=UPI0030819151
MGSLLCKQRSGHTAESSRRRKQQRGDCLLRGPCMLCFIVHSNPRETPSSEQASPDLPAARTAAQDCARLLLLCPAELSAWQERSLLCAGFTRGAEFRTVTSPQPGGAALAADMVCKRKNCGGSQKPRTPCKLPRCAPDGGLSDSGVGRQEHVLPFSGGLPHTLEDEQAPHFSGDQTPLCLKEEQCTGHPEPPSSKEPLYQLTGDPARPSSEGPLCHPAGDPAPPSSEEPLNQSTVEPAPSCSQEPVYHSSGDSIPTSLVGTLCHPTGHTGTPCSEEPEYHVLGDATAPCSDHPAVDPKPSCSEGHIYHLSANAIVPCTEELNHQLTRDLATSSPEDKTQDLTSEHLQPNTLQPGHPLSVEPEPQNDQVFGCSSSCLDSASYLHPAHSQVQPQCPSFCIREADPENHKVEADVAFPCEQFHINQLPPSLLLKIFSHLSMTERCLSASLVCKYWHDLCLDFQFWKQLDLSSREQVKDDLLERIASRCCRISELNISDCLNVTDVGICIFALKCSVLVKYTAYRCKQLSDLSLISLATHCPSLQKVHVGNQDRLTDEALKQIGSRCRDLRDIHFGQCYKISDEGMIVIAKGCPKLRKIYMQENKLVSDKSVEAFAEHCPELQYVGFMGCAVTSKGVIRLTNLKNLSSLDLRHINELDNETVMEIVKKCRNLTSLNLCLNRNIDDRCVEVIAKEGRSLKELYLVTCKITDHEFSASLGCSTD